MPVRMCALRMRVGHVEKMSERCLPTRAQIDIPERDRHVHMYVRMYVRMYNCEIRSLIQSLTLMRSAMSSRLGTSQPGSSVRHSTRQCTH